MPATWVWNGSCVKKDDGRMRWRSSGVGGQRDLAGGVRGGLCLECPAHGERELDVEYEKGIQWMPWHQEAMKDVARCEKPRGGASTL